MTDEIKRLHRDLVRDWELNLEAGGVEMPKESSVKFRELLCLYAHMPYPMTQEEIGNWLAEKFGMDYVKQARHLADSGWDLRSGNSRFTRGVWDPSLKRNQLRLHSVESPNPKWVEENQKRVGFMNAETWEKVLEVYKDRGCAVCGRKFPKYDKGHLLQDKGVEPGNIVPMCSECNNWGQEMEFKLDRGLVARPFRWLKCKGGIPCPHTPN